MKLGNMHIKINGWKFEQVQVFKYMGKAQEDDSKLEEEINDKMQKHEHYKMDEKCL